MRFLKHSLCVFLVVVIPSISFAETNTVSSTVVDKSVPTASAPSVMINNSDVCKSAASAAIQTQILGFASGITITDRNCERLKLSRALYGMGMKVAAIASLCQDSRVFDAMLMAGTPCPFRGQIGDEAKAGWEENPDLVPSGSQILKKKSDVGSGGDGDGEVSYDSGPENYDDKAEEEVPEFVWVGVAGLVLTGLAVVVLGLPIPFF
jgi:hypothetical protein